MKPPRKSAQLTCHHSWQICHHSWQVWAPRKKIKIAFFHDQGTMVTLIMKLTVTCKIGSHHSWQISHHSWKADCLIEFLRLEFWFFAPKIFPMAGNCLLTLIMKNSIILFQIWLLDIDGKFDLRFQPVIAHDRVFTTHEKYQVWKKSTAWLLFVWLVHFQIT